MNEKTKSIAELRQKAHLPAKDYGKGRLGHYFAAHEKQIATVIPKHMTSDRMLRIAVNAISSTPQLADCTVESLLGAVIQSSIMGLEPNTPLGHAYLVPFNNTKMKRKEVQFIPGYKGLIDLARRSGQIESINAHEVYSEDVFEFEYGLEEKLVHKPSWEKDRGHMVGAYAVAKFKDGGYIFEVMSLAQIESIRDNSQGYRAAKKFGFQSPWMGNFDEMARKTCIRRIAKYLPMSIELQDAVALDNLSEKAQSQNLSDVLEGGFTVVEPSDQEIASQREAQIEEQGWFENELGEKVNAHGEIWNPEVHATGRDSHGPIVNTDGSFRAKRGTSKVIEYQPDDDGKEKEPANEQKQQEKTGADKPEVKTAAAQEQEEEEEQEEDDTPTHTPETDSSPDMELD
jgi:recombination protein RecT